MEPWSGTWVQKKWNCWIEQLYFPMLTPIRQPFRKWKMILNWKCMIRKKKGDLESKLLVLPLLLNYRQLLDCLLSISGKAVQVLYFAQTETINGYTLMTAHA
jgi:hypothetical protein